MENTREKNKRADGRKKTYFDRENKKKAARTEKTKSVAPEKGKQKKSSSSSKCPYQKKCGGCTYLNLSYEEQLAKKEQFLKKTLKGIVPVKGMVGMENPYHYRNKVNSAFARKKDGTIISGIYEKGTHKVVPVDECLLEDQRADAIIRDIRSLLKSFKIMIYNEDSGYGLLRHVMVRTGFASGEIMVVLVCVSPVFPSKNNFVKALRKLHPEITTIVLNVNDRTDSMVLGKRDIVLFGRGYIEDELCGCTFRISPQSFYQVNPVQTKNLYEKAISLAGLTGNERLNLFYLAVLVLGLNIWTTNDNALYTAGLGLANIFHQRKKPMVLLSGIIGTVASVWLYYNFCGWLNILNCTLPPVGMILVLAYFMNKEDFETDQPKLKTIDWFAVAGVILGAIVANLLHWGIASINGMVVAAVCYCVGQAVNKRK